MFTSKGSRKALFTDKRPLFYYITDSGQLTGAAFYACIRRALQWGVDFIQIREKHLPDRSLFELTRRIVKLADRTKCRILVNGRADIAWAAGAHGVHLPSDSLRVSEIRSWLPKNLLIGISVHSKSEVKRACEEGADYILLGHLFPTPSKSGYGSPLGLDNLRKICSGFSAPVFGLGGIKANCIESVLDSGAVGVAGIRLFQNRSEFNDLKKLYPSRID
ncbi:MAG: thiamine phosphate synthase [Acidobacteria bacterium]|nr:thiamine phosphate synthase [Acidobacteriota bacterium]